MTTATSWGTWNIMPESWGGAEVGDVCETAVPLPELLVPVVGAAVELVPGLPPPVTLQSS